MPSKRSAASRIPFSLAVKGMTCSSCATKIEKQLASLPGAAACSVNFATLRASIDFDLNSSAALSSAAKPSDKSTKKVEVLDGSKTQHLIPDRLSNPDVAVTAAAVRGFYQAVLTTLSQMGYTAVLLGTGRKRFIVKGMSCGSCALPIENAILSSSVGVLEASVVFTSSTAEVLFLEGVASMPAAEKAIVSSGYSVANTATSVQKATQPKQNESADADNNENSSRVAFVDDNLADASENENLQMAGALERREEITLYRNRFFGSLVFSAPLMIAMFVFMTDHSLMSFEEEHAKIINAVYMGFATPAVVYFGRDYFIHAFLNLRRLHFTMDTLVAFGVGGAYLFSIVALALLFLDIKATCYFDTAAELVTFMLLGRYLESLAKAKTSDALVLLLRLTPPTANLIKTIADGTKEVVTVPSASLQNGDCVRVAAGEKIPVDGEVVDGISEVDEAAVTGESVPRHVTPGAKVVGGTVNTVSVLTVKATAVGSDTVVSQIIRIVEDAQKTKPAIQRFADRIASVFVPCVISISASVFLIWSLLGYFKLYPEEWHGAQSPYVFAFQNFLSTLVVACPCALGLAAPTAVMVGTGIGAEMGVLSKSGIVLETAPLIDTFIFDKTGTLTTGKLEVTSAFYFDANPADLRSEVETTNTTTPMTSSANHPPSRVEIKRDAESLSSHCRSALAAVAVVEGMATHPIATAITHYIKNNVAAALLHVAVSPLPPPNPHAASENADEATSFSTDRHQEGQPKPSNDALLASNGEQSHNNTTSNEEENGNRKNSESAAAAGEVRNHVVIGGKGISADLGGSHVRVGTVSFITDGLDKVYCHRLPPSADKALARMAEEGRTVVAASVDGQLVALFGLADEPKPEAKAVVLYLKNKRNKKVMMVTGDNAAAAFRIAKAVGIDECDVRASCMPAEKERIVSFEQQPAQPIAISRSIATQTDSALNVDFDENNTDSEEDTQSLDDSSLTKGLLEGNNKERIRNGTTRKGKADKLMKSQHRANYDSCAVQIEDNTTNTNDSKNNQQYAVQTNSKKSNHSLRRRVVAFIGDGINDSPALAQSDVGIALGAGTDIAVECADAVLMRDSLADIITFIDLSTTVVRRIRFNFVWALGYNLIMLPVAAGALYPVFGRGLPPVVAGIAMILSSLSVLASSLALRCFSRRRRLEL